VGEKIFDLGDLDSVRRCPRPAKTSPSFSSMNESEAKQCSVVELIIVYYCWAVGIDAF
jgi:hypothetical protein